MTDIRPIDGHPAYLAGADGTIYSEARGTRHALRPGTQHLSRGYERKIVCLGRGNIRKVATLVCATFHGERPTPDHEVAHLNGNSLDNRAANLAWKTHAENEADKIVHGRTNRGTRQWQAKLTEQQVREIRSLAAAGVAQQAIRQRFGVSQPTVSEIVSRKKWAWLP